MVRILTFFIFRSSFPFIRQTNGLRSLFILPEASQGEDEGLPATGWSAYDQGSAVHKSCGSSENGPVIFHDLNLDMNPLFRDLCYLDYACFIAGEGDGNGLVRAKRNLVLIEEFKG